MMELGAAAPNPAARCTCQPMSIIAGGKEKFPEWKDVRSKKVPELNYGHIKNHSKTYVFWMPVDLNAGPEVLTQYFLAGKTIVEINVNII